MTPAWGLSELPHSSAGATVWRLAHRRLQTSELKNYSRFHFPALCAFRCLWRQARPVKWRGGGRETAPMLEKKESLWMWGPCRNTWLGGCVYMSACVYPQTQCVLLSARFEFSVQWSLRCVFSSQRSVLYVGMGAGQSTVPSLALSKELLHWEGQFFTGKKIMALVNPA